MLMYNVFCFVRKRSKVWLAIVSCQPVRASSRSQIARPMTHLLLRTHNWNLIQQSVLRTAVPHYAGWSTRHRCIAAAKTQRWLPSGNRRRIKCSRGYAQCLHELLASSYFLSFLCNSKQDLRQSHQKGCGSPPCIE